MKKYQIYTSQTQSPKTNKQNMIVIYYFQITRICRIHRIYSNHKYNQNHQLFEITRYINESFSLLPTRKIYIYSYCNLGTYFMSSWMMGVNHILLDTALIYLHAYHHTVYNFLTFIYYSFLVKYLPT